MLKKRDEAIEEFDRKISKLEGEYREVKKENTKIKDYIYLLTIAFVVVVIASFLVLRFTGHVVSDFSSGTLTNAVLEGTFSHVTISSADGPYVGGTIPTFCSGVLTCPGRSQELCGYIPGCSWGGAASAYCDGTAVGTDCSVYSNPADQTDCQNNHPGCSTSNDGDCDILTQRNEPCSTYWGCVGSQIGYGWVCTGTYSTDCLGTTTPVACTDGSRQSGLTECAAGASGCDWHDAVSDSCGSTPTNDQCSQWNSDNGGCTNWQNNGQCTWNAEQGGQGLVAYYSFDGDNIGGLSAKDYSSNSLDGGYGGGATTVTGLYGDAASFDGTDDYLSVADNALFDSSAITVCAWINASAPLGASQNGAVVSHGDDSWRLLVGLTSKAIFGTTGVTPLDLQSSANVVDGTWHHICGTYNGNNKTIYVDGNLDASVSATGALQTSTNAVWIGGNEGAGTQDYNGLVDEVMIFNYSLSAGQISAIYSNTSNRFAASSGTHTFDIDMGTNTTTNITLGDYVVPNGTNITAQMTIASNLGEIATFVDGTITDYVIPTGSGTSGTLTLTYNTDANRFLSPIAGANVSIDAWGASEYLSSSAHYKMNDADADTNVVDSLGAHNGTASMEVGSYLATTGKINGALNFNGSTSVNLGNNFKFVSDNFSIAGWVNIGSFADTTNMLVRSHQGSGDQNGDIVLGVNADGKIHFTGLDSGSNWVFGYYNAATLTTGVLNAGQWYHVVVTRAGENYTMYVDGTIADEGTSSANFNDADNTHELSISGTTYPAYPIGLNGSLDDFRIYNFTLSSAQVATLYNSGSGTEDEIGATVADIIGPSIVIINPEQYANYSTRILDLNYSVSDDTGLDSCWYSFDAGVTPSASQVCGTNWTGLTALDDGDNRWTVYANDTLGNTNSEDVFFYVDSLAPAINFTNPTSSGTVNGNAIYVNLTTNDTNEHYSFVDFERSLSLWLRMDDVNASGDPTDLSSYSLNGSRKGSPVQTTSGKFGKGFDLSPSGTSYIELPFANFNNPTTEITVSAWIYVNQFFNYNRIVSRSGWSNAGNYSWIMYTDVNNRSTFGVSNGTSSTGPSSSINGFAKNTWYHIVGTYNGTKVSLYVNGVLNSSSATNVNTTNIVFTPISTYLRVGSATVDSYFNGTVDEVMIFNRSLSASEIASLYNATANQYSNNFTSLSAGSHSFVGYAVDSYGHKNQTETRTVTLEALADTTFPLVSLVYPTNTSYNSIVTKLNYTVSDETALSACWYFNGTGNTTVTCGTNATITSSEGSNTWIVYANDTTGNVNSSSITFSVDTIVPSVNFTSPTPSGTMTADSIYVNLTTSDANNHYSLVDFDNSIIGWWRGENNANDENGLHNASWNGTAIYGAGKFGSAFSFNRANGYVNTSKVFNQSTFSASVWFKANSLVNGSNILNNGFYSTDTSTTEFNRSWQLRLGWSEGTKIWFCVGNSTDGNCLGNSSNHVGIQGYLVANNWYHIVVTYDGSNGNASLYLDGVRNWSDSRPNMDLPTEPLIIGKDPGVLTNTLFDGLMDEVLLFNRTLNAAEVLSLYDSQSNKYENNFTSLVSGSHTVTGYAVDSSGNKNQTEMRTITLEGDTIAPTISFISPTPTNGTNSTNNFITSFIEANDANYKNYSYYLYNSTGLVSNSKYYGDDMGISAGEYNNCVLLNNGNVTCWGENGFGQSENYTLGNAIAISAGYAHTCILLNNGNITCQGDNTYGESANYTLGNVIGVSAGYSHTCALLNNGNINCWGDNQYGQSNNYTLGNAIAVAAANSGEHTCALLNNGNVTCWGYNGGGEANNYTLGNAIAVSTGYYSTCILLNNGNVICRGLNDNGQSVNYTQGDAIGVSVGYNHACILSNNGNITCQGDSSFGESANYTLGNAIGVATGYRHSCALLNNGNVTCWGLNGDGQSENYTLGNVKKQALYAFMGLAEGTYYLNASACDTSSNCNWTETRTIIVDAVPADTTAPRVSYTYGTPINGDVDSSIFVNTSIIEANQVNVTYYLYNSSGLYNSTKYTTNVTSISWNVASGSYSYQVNVTDNSSNVNSTVMRTITILPSCACTEGSNCTISSDCYLNNNSCSAGLCQFTNLTISASLYTLYDASGNGNNLYINLTSNETSPLTFLTGGKIIFNGRNGTDISGLSSAGGNAGLVNITVQNLLNTTYAFFYGIGGTSTSSASGGNGGNIGLYFHGLIRMFTDGSNQDGNGDLYPDNTPILAGGSSSGLPGNAGTATYSRTLSCPLDPDIDADGVVFNLDRDLTKNAYANRTGDSTYISSQDINCDNFINVIELSREGFQWETRGQQ